MSAIQHRLAAIVARDPAVDGVVAFAGATGGNATENTARMFMQLKPFGQRNVSADQVIQRLRAKTAVVPGVRFYMQAGQDINVGGRLAARSTSTPSRIRTRRSSTTGRPSSSMPWRSCRSCRTSPPTSRSRPRISPSISTATWPIAWGCRSPSSTRPLYDAFGQRQIATIYSSTNQYKVDPRGGAANSRPIPTALGGLFIRGPDRRAGAAQRRRAFHPEGRSRSRSITRASSLR